MHIPLPTLTATEAFAQTLARLARPGDCIALSGDLGMGKTTFARAFIHALAPEAGDIASPTFALVQPYPTPRGTVWHFDLYRLRSAAELAELGLDEALRDGISLIEWPEIANAHLPPETLWLTLLPGDAPGARRLNISATESWRTRLENME